MIRKTKKAPQVTPVDLEFQASIHNRFDIEVIDAKTGEIKQRAQAKNIICDGLWTYAANQQTWNQAIAFGTGTGTPTSTDTALFSYLGRKKSTVYKSELREAGVYAYTTSIQLADTEYVGQTLTEVGIMKESGGVLCTHAMLQDMNGNPITITKTNTDIVNIYATVFVHYNPLGYNGILFNPVADSGSTFRIIATAGYVPIGSILAGVVGSYNHSYVGTEHYYDVAFSESRVAATTGNSYKNIYDILTRTYGNSYIVGLKIPSKAIFPQGITITGEAIGTGDGQTVDFMTKFPGISNCTVKVDGIPVLVTVDEHVPFVTSAGNVTAPTPWRYLESTTTINGTRVWRYFSGQPSIEFSVSPGYRYIWRNPHHATLGIAKFLGGSQTYQRDGLSYYMSPDCENWVLIGINNSSAGVTVPVAYQNYEWIKVQNDTNETKTCHMLSNNFQWNRSSDYNIHFSTPPAAGAVITADYTTDVIAKDENHVFEFSASAQVGEYTE